MKQTQLVTNALVLALCAPDDEHSQRATELAEHFAQGLEPAEVEKCKADALAVVKAWGPA